MTRYRALIVRLYVLRVLVSPELFLFKSGSSLSTVSSCFPRKVEYLRRSSQQDIECIPLLRLTEHEPGTFHPGPDSQWDCQLLPWTPAAMGKSGKIVKLDDIYNLPEDTIQQFKSGGSVLTIPGATVESAGIKFPLGAQAKVVELNVTDGDTLLSPGGGTFHPAAGNKKVLAIRVKTRSASTTASAAQLSDSVFGTSGDPMNLVSQYDACSYGKLTFSPLTSLNSGDPSLDAPGVYEVELDTSSMDHEYLREAITDKLNADWPGTPLPSVSWGELDESVPFDYVMYCLPPGTNMGIAYAFANSWLSVYSDEWCTYLSTQMHEVGHNLDLDHSGEDTNSYGDQSGMMGYSYSDDDGPRMCFNAGTSRKVGASVLSENVA